MKRKTFIQLVKQIQVDRDKIVRVKVGYVVDQNVHEQFAELCVRQGISASKAVQMLMEAALSEEKP